MQNIANIFQIYEFFIIFLYFSFWHKLSSSQNKLLYFMSVSLHIFYIMLFKGLQQFNIIIIMLCCCVIKISVIYFNVICYYYDIFLNNYRKKTYKTLLSCGELKCTETILKYWNISANKTTLVLHEILYLNYCIPSTFVIKYISILALLINNFYNYKLSCMSLRKCIYQCIFYYCVFLFTGLC